MIGKTVSHYRILEKLGGGMGEVYKAGDTRLGRSASLRFLLEGLAENCRAPERFQQEAQAVSALNYPKICTVYNIDKHNHEPCHRQRAI
jgi:serine/threonine protein kinase